MTAGTTLVQVFNQLGPEITSDTDTVRVLMHRFGISDTNPPKDASVIEYMVVLARLAADGSVLGDVGSFVRAISSFVSAFIQIAMNSTQMHVVEFHQLG